MDWAVLKMFPSKQDSPGGPVVPSQETCIRYRLYLLVWVSCCVWQLQTCPKPARLWGCVHLFTVTMWWGLFSHKLCIPLSIPSEMLDAKSPQGMCQHLLNTLCTLLLILHCCGFTVGEMQMAAHGIALWGKKGNTAYFSNAGFIFPAFVDFFAFFCCMDNFSATISQFHLPKAFLLYRQDFLHMTYKYPN